MVEITNKYIFDCFYYSIILFCFLSLGPASFHGPITQAPSVTNTPTAVAPSSNLSGPSVTCDSSPMEPISSPLAATTLETPNSTPLSRTPFLRSHTSPVTVMTGSTGKSPLRSCHTNSDAVTNLRRLATATFNSSPPNRSPTVVRQEQVMKFFIFISFYFS